MAKGTKHNQNAPHSSIQPQSTTTPKEGDKDGALEWRKYVYERINGWIENADNKVSISCGVFTGVFGIVTFLAQTYIKKPAIGAVANEFLRSVYRCCFLVSLVLMGTAIFFFVWAIIPNLEKSGKVREKKDCPIFYGDISKISLDEYRQLMNKATAEHFCEELITETHQNAKICMNKMERYKAGVKIAFIAIVVAGISFISHFFMYR